MHDTTLHCATVDRSIVSVLGNSSTRDPGGYKRYPIGKRTRVLRSRSFREYAKSSPNKRSASSAISARSCSFLAAQPPVGEPDRIDLRDGLMHVLARAEDQGELSPDADLASMADFFEEGNVAMAHMKMHPLSRGLLASIISLVPR